MQRLTATAAGFSGQGDIVPLPLAHSNTCSPHGTFRTFTAGRQFHDLAHATRLLSSHESKRTAKWMSMIRENSSGWSWFDRFVSCVTARIGSDPTVDCAIDFTLESYATFRREWEPAWDRSAQKSGITAMMTLRHGLDATPTFDRITVAIITGLFCVAEVSDFHVPFATSNQEQLFRAIRGCMNYVIHMQASARLLASYTKAGSSSELEETLLYMIVLEEVCPY